MNITTKEVREVKTSLTDYQFLTSESFKSYLKRVAQNITKRYDLNIVFSNAVKTDNKTIWLNPNLPESLKVDTLPKKVLIMIGCLAHEIFHVEYSDFSILKAEFPADRYRSKIMHFIANIIEDAYIESRGYYLGLFSVGVNFLNEAISKIMVPIDKAPPGTSPLSILLQAALILCVLKKDNIPIMDAQASEYFKKTKPLFLEAIVEPDAKKRRRYARKITGIILPLIEAELTNNLSNKAEDYYQNPKQEQEVNGGMFDEKNIVIIKKSRSSTTPDKTKPDTQTDDQEDDDIQPDTQMDEQEEDDSQADAQTDDQEDDDIQPDTQTDDQEDDDIQPDTQMNEQEEDDSQADAQTDDQEDDDIQPDAQTDDQKDDEDEILSSLEQQMDQIKNDVSRQICHDAKIKQDNEQWVRDVKGICYPAIHQNINVVPLFLNRNTEHDTQKYNAAKKSLLPVINGATRKFKEVIKYNEDVKLSGLCEGRLDRNKLYRPDNQFFYKRKEKSEESDLVILVAVDLSHSMIGGHRFERAISSVIVLAEMCKALDIPLAVIGHKAISGKEEVIHYHLKDFESPLNEFELTGGRTIYPSHNTREGLSLRYCGEYISKRPEKDKLIFSISDGGTEHTTNNKQTNYRGESAQKDVRKEAARLERSGINVFGMAIGAGAQEIAQNYPHSIVVIDPGKLPDFMVKALKEKLFR